MNPVYPETPTNGDMRNKALALTAASTPYIPALRSLAGTIAAAIIMQQLDFWFARHPGGFYKFLEPAPKNPNFRARDSWCEELNITSDEFRAAFDKIGTRYTSKGQFDAVKTSGDDVFAGQFYASYHDKIKGLTYYFRNHALVDTALDKLFASIYVTGNSHLRNLEKPIYATGESPSTQMGIASYVTGNAHLDNKEAKTTPNNTHIKTANITADAAHASAPDQTSSVSDAPAAVFVEKCDEAGELTALVMSLDIARGDADSIVRQALAASGGAERIKRNVSWFRKHKAIKGVRNVGGMFRTCIKDDWARVAIDVNNGRQADNEQAARARNRAASTVPAFHNYDADPTAGDRDDEATPARNNDANDVDKTHAVLADLASRMVVKAPPPPARCPASDALIKPAPTKTPQVDVQAIWQSLSSCAQERLHQEAINRAAASAPFRADEIAAVLIDDKIEEKGMAARLVLAERAQILRERGAAPISMLGKTFYDKCDAQDYYDQRVNADFGN